jgi:nucleotide-binding universal stress UspA family protein
MKTIVLGYDGTDASARALARTAEIATAFGSSVIVTSVAGTLGGAVHAGGAGDPTDPPDAHDALLDQATSELAERGVQAESVLGLGSASEAIVELADEKGADLIVVGTREPGFFERLLGHSVSGSVQRQARCDVLIVH